MVNANVIAALGWGLRLFFIFTSGSRIRYWVTLQGRWFIFQIQFFAVPRRCGDSLLEHHDYRA